MAIEYRKLNSDDLTFALFETFDRYQEVKQCWRKVNNEWILEEVEFVDDWDKDEKVYLVECLKNTIKIGGVVIAALNGENLVGFASIENKFFGTKNQYLQLSSLHVSYHYRGHGTGKDLFERGVLEAKNLGASKLYISSHSSKETQAFYKKMNCVNAMEINKEIADLEPCDCQLEYCIE